MQTINWKPFSLKHINYILACHTNKVNAAEGAVRAAKTITNCIAFARELEYTPDKIHLATGSTIANAKLNIGDCNGFGLEYLFGGRCRWGKFKDNEALFIETKTGEKIVVFAGGGKADSYKKILGNSYGLWIATEINEHFDSDDSRTSFIKVALARQLAAKNPKVFWDLNPSNPNARIYFEYLDKWAKDGLVGGYNYQHFTIFDNLSITEQRKEEIISMYNPETIQYKRDILGQRVVYQGLIYKEFAENHGKYVLKQLDEQQLLKLCDELAYVSVGIDFGGNLSKHSFVCTGITRGFREVYGLESERVETGIPPNELDKKFIEFIGKCYRKYKKPIFVFPDSAEQVLIDGFKIAGARSGIPHKLANARKSPIKDRIDLVLKLLAQNRLHIFDNCVSLINALDTAVWDNKAAEQGKDERLDNGTSDIDTLDGFEYSIEQYSQYLLAKGGM